MTKYDIQEEYPSDGKDANIVRSVLPRSCAAQMVIPLSMRASRMPKNAMEHLAYSIYTLLRSLRTRLQALASGREREVEGSIGGACVCTSQYTDWWPWTALLALMGFPKLITRHMNPP